MPKFNVPNITLSPIGDIPPGTAFIDFEGASVLRVEDLDCLGDTMAVDEGGKIWRYDPEDLGILSGPSPSPTTGDRVRILDVGEYEATRRYLEGQEGILQESTFGNFSILIDLPGYFRGKTVRAVKVERVE